MNDLPQPPATLGPDCRNRPPETHDFRDHGNPLEKVYPMTDWRAWERRTDMDMRN